MRYLIGALIVLITASCGSLQALVRNKQLPSVGFRFQEQLLHEEFDAAGDWRSYDSGADLFMGVESGVYHIDFVGRKYVWTQNERQFSNLVIEAEVAQASDYDHNAYGLACRLDPANSGRGYFFLISGDGYASIRWSNGRSLEPIVSAAPSARINRGRASNRIRAICIEDYLALWVNGEFVAEARDRRAASGMTGLVGVMNYENRRLTLNFDDLKIWQAEIDGGAP